MNDTEIHRRMHALAQQIGVAERKLDFLLKSLNLTFVDERPPPSKLEQLILDGERLEAVKLYASEHKVKLAEAHREVDALAAKLGV